MRLFGISIIAVCLCFSPLSMAKTFKTEHWRTKNGVDVVFYQAKEVPMLDISLAFAGGSAYDEEHYGLSAFTAQILNQGNAGKDATAVAQSLADVGAQFNAETSRDMVIFNLRTLTEPKALTQSTQTFNQIINHPDFPDEAFENEKKQLLMAVEQDNESPEEIANLRFFQTLYQHHPYAHPISGTTKTLEAISKKQVVDFYKQYYVAHNAVLVFVGAIDSSKAHQLAEQITKDLPQGTSAAQTPKALPLTKAEAVNIAFPSTQTMVRLGQIGIDHNNPQYFPLMVGNYILGGGPLISRLSVEVREKRGLTYGIDSQFTPMPGEGPFIISLSTQNEQAPNALKITEDTLNQFIKNGPTQQELDAAKQHLTGSFPLSLESNSAIAGLLLRMSFYHLPDDYLDSYVKRINGVTVEEIKLAFKQQIRPDKLVLVTVGQKTQTQ